MSPHDFDFDRHPVTLGLAEQLATANARLPSPLLVNGTAAGADALIPLAGLLVRDCVLQPGTGGHRPPRLSLARHVRAVSRRCRPGRPRRPRLLRHRDLVGIGRDRRLLAGNGEHCRGSERRSDAKPFHAQPRPHGGPGAGRLTDPGVRAAPRTPLLLSGGVCLHRSAPAAADGEGSQHDHRHA